MLTVPRVDRAAAFYKTWALPTVGLAFALAFGLVAFGLGAFGLGAFGLVAFMPGPLSAWLLKTSFGVLFVALWGPSR